MKNLPRWMFASVAKHFSDVASTIPLPCFVEGVEERQPTSMRQDHCEIRMTGPFVKEISNGYYRVEAPINILLTNLMEMSGENAYDIVQWCGVFQEAMLEPIPVYRYGAGVNDDDTLVGCLRIKKNKVDAVNVYHFGQVHKTDRVRQAELDAMFEMWILDPDQ